MASSLSNLRIRKFKNSDNTIDYWIYDLNRFGSVNPAATYIDISDKYDESYIVNLFKKEARAYVKGALEMVNVIKSKKEKVKKVKANNNPIIKSTVSNLEKTFSEFFG